MDVADFDYTLPQDAIAQVPPAERGHSRLLLVERQTGFVADHSFSEIADILNRPHAIFRNDVMVLKARIQAQRPSGGKVECLLLTPRPEMPDSQWWCLVKPGRKLQVRDTFSIDGVFTATILEKQPDGATLVSFELSRHTSVAHMANEFGSLPLPPYISRNEADERVNLDNVRYQTIYADPAKPFAVAAPTAGLHFTPGINDRLMDLGHRFHDLTLHIGLGTFKPIKCDKVEDHQMHEEFYEIPSPTLAALQGSMPKLAVGTTSLRAMEDCFRKNRKSPISTSQSFSSFADLYIYPPETLHVDALLTNFHLPRSTLLCLVSAFLTPDSTDGIQWLKQIYMAALKRGYRFYSYGDAMLII